MALQRTRRPRFRSGRALRSLGSPLNARPLGNANLGLSRIASLAGVVGGVLLFAGSCRPHTYVGMNYYFPPGSQPPAAQYHLSITVRGSAGRAYVDRTEKTVYVTITGGSATEFTRKYTLTAADLHTNVVWDQLSDLHIDLVEPTGASSPTGSRERQLLTLRFAHDPQTGEFTEARLAPEAVPTPVDYSRQRK